jgi:hypothetical protein
VQTGRGKIVLIGVAAHCAFCVVCGLTTGLIPWHWRFKWTHKARKRSVCFLPPEVDIKTRPVSFMLAMLFEVLMALFLVQVARYGLRAVG